MNGIDGVWHSDAITMQEAEEAKEKLADALTKGMREVVINGRTWFFQELEVKVATTRRRNLPKEPTATEFGADVNSREPAEEVFSLPEVVPDPTTTTALGFRVVDDSLRAKNTSPIVELLLDGKTVALPAGRTLAGIATAVRKHGKRMHYRTAGDEVILWAD